MAELALGLTRTVVEGALSRIQWAIEEEDKLKEGVQQDLEFITGEFQMMQSFLKVANKERARKNEVARAWVRQLRDLAFDVEDWVEFVAHLKKDKSWCSCWWRLVPSCAVPQCLAPPRDLDEATAEMKLLKARVQDVSQRNTRYNLFNSDNSGLSSSLDSKAVMPIASDLPSTAFQVLRQVWSDETDRLRNVGGLPRLITSEVVGDDLQVIWLWESDDHYASQLIHMAYQDEEICRSFKLCAWVKIMHPFNLQAFLNTLAAQFLSVGCSQHQATSDGLTSTAELIQQATKEKRYLIILEQVSDLVEWNAIRKYLPENNKGSRIVVSTQNLRRALLCTRMPYLVSELGWFTDRRPSICAFYHKAAGKSGRDMDTLIGKIKHGSVISVYGRGTGKSSVVKRLYLSIQQNPGILQGVRFHIFKWVPVVVGHPFKLVDLSRRVHLDLSAYGFYDGGLKELFDIFGGTILEEVLCKNNEEELIESSRKIMNTANCLVVIDGLRSKKDWDDVRTILPAEPTKCCFIVVTDDERLARYCVDDNKDLLVHVSEGLQVAGMAQGSIREMAISWMRKMSDPHLCKRQLHYDKLINECIAVTRPPVVSVWDIAGVGKSTPVNWSYTKKMLDPENIKHKFSYYCWVDVPHPFSLVELSLRLLRQFCLDYASEVKETVMIDMLESHRDQIQECCLLLKHFNQWLLVLDGLRSTDDWDSINEAFCLSQPTLGCKTIVVTNEQDVAMHCANKNDKQVISVHVLEADEADEALKLFKEKEQGPIRETAIAWMRRISDPNLSKRRLLYDKLINDCIAITRPHVASVWGIAGVGKSTLVNWSYTKKMLDPENIKHKFSYYCWVDVPHPFSLAELSLRLLQKFFLGYPSEVQEIVMIDMLEGHRDQIQECRLLLRHYKQWLLVLDGLRSTDDWDTINEAFCLSQPTVGCKTIVVTNEQHVAMHCANKNDRQMISVQVLQADEALKFFKEKISMRNIDKEPSDMTRVSESIMAKCGGLPKVITAVAQHYNNMSSDKATYMKLKDINDNFMHILEGLHTLRALFSWMQHYLETCQDDLKPCIFYLPVFPIRHNIRLRRLQMRWIAEGYSRDTSSHTADRTNYIDNSTERLFSDLRQFSMFQVQPSSKPVKFRVNGFLHEYINSRPMEDNFVSALEGSCSMWPQRARTQHLTIHENWERDMKMFESTDFTRLRSLTVFGECCPWMFDPAKIKMRYVRVLDLEDAKGVTNDDLKNIVEVFPRLKFLSLRRCGKITRLPKSLGHLRQLQTLDIRDIPVARLPEAILKLEKLQYLRAGTIHSAPWYEGGIMVPYQTMTPGEIISTSVTVEDGTTFAAAPSAPAEDAPSPIAIESAPEDTTIYERPPLSPAEVAMTFAAAPSAPAEDALTPSAIALDSEDTEGSPMTGAAPRSRHHALVCSWLSKVGCCSQSSLDNTNNGVEVPAGIGKLTSLHTFGVANVGHVNNSVILKELHKLTKLCRLSVCGINLDNIHQFFSEIAGLRHLDRLSVRLDKNMDGLFPSLDNTIRWPPKTLSHVLKLHGHVRILPGSWIKEFADVECLDLEVTLQEQQDMQVILDHLIHRTNGSMKRLCIKPTQHGELCIGISAERENVRLRLRVLEIVCTTNLQATIGNIGAVDVLRVECSTGSSLQFSGLQKIRSLKEVWLKGSCSDTLKQDLQRQLDQRQDRDKTVLKVFQPSSS